MAGLSFESDIQSLFRPKDVETMKRMGSFDLSDYEDVRSYARAIYDRLSDGTMPCDGPWPQAQVERFKRWMEGGMAP